MNSNGAPRNTYPFILDAGIILKGTNGSRGLLREEARRMSLGAIVEGRDFYFKAGNLCKISWIKGDDFET